MSHEQLKSKDKVVLKMTKDGAVEENLTEGTSEKITKRLEDAQLIKPNENVTLVSPVEEEKLRMRHQLQWKEPEQPEPTEVQEEILPDDSIPETTSKVERLERKSEKAHARLDSAREKLPTRKVIKKERVFDEETGKGKTRLFFDDELKKPKEESKLQFEVTKPIRKVGDTLVTNVHGKIHEVEQENSAVEAAHRTEILAESTVRHYSHHQGSQSNKPSERVSKLEQEAQTADTKLHYEKTCEEHPEIKPGRKDKDMNKYYQKSSIKKEYVAARKSGTQTASTATSDTGKKVGEVIGEKLKEFFSENKSVFIWIGIGLVVLILFAAGISSCTVMISSVGQSVITTSYLSEDEDMLNAESQYSSMEAMLQDELNNFMLYYPGYDEYNFNIGEIEHDPYVLISILSALHEGEFTLSEVQSELMMLFEMQYTLTTEVTTEVRYRIETQVGSYLAIDPYTGALYTQYYTYEAEVPYDYFIINVTLESIDLSQVAANVLSQDQLELYESYMSVLGNREDLFPYSEYVTQQ